MFDLSGNTTTVGIWWSQDGSSSPMKDIVLQPSSFAFESNPISIGSVPLAKIEIDLNGHPILVRQRVPIRVTLSLIPGSEGDIQLQNALYVCRNPSENVLVGVSELSVQYPSGRKVSFLNGYMVGGTPGVGIKPEGRIGQGGEYVFEFMSYKVPEGNGLAYTDQINY